MKAAAPAETRMFFASDLPASEVWALGSGEVAVLSTPRPGRTGPNEDAAAVLALGADAGLLAVADGMGALPGGDDAARCALDQLARAVRNGVGEERGLREAILDGFEAANRAVADLGIGAGTTLAAVELRGRHVRSYHVGDSAVMVVGQRGKLKHLTISHSPVGYAVEAGVLDEEEALVHEDRHVISNMIGSPEMKIEMGPVLELGARDTLLVATDGLFDNLRLEEIAEAIRKGPLGRGVTATAVRCHQRMAEVDPEHPGKPDDLTLVVYRPTRVGRR